jgi:PAS domain S-box-containing protein
MAKPSNHNLPYEIQTKANTFNNCGQTSFNSQQHEPLKEKHFELFELAPVASFVLNESGLIEEVNSAGCTLLGLEKTSLLNKRFNLFIKTGIKNFHAARKISIDTGNITSCELRVTNSQNTKHNTVTQILAAIGSNGQRIFKLAVMDIPDYKRTEGQRKYLIKKLNKRIVELKRTESEEKFRSLAENSPDIIARFDTRLCHTYINPAGQKALDMSFEKIIGKTMEQLDIPLTLAIQWEEKMKQIISTRNPATIEYSITGHHHTRYYQMIITPELDEKQSFKSLLSVTRDITELKQAEQLKDEFIGMVSHELRTPLTILMASISVALSENISSEQIHSLLIDAECGAESLSHLLNNLLELSRYQAKRLQLTKSRLDINTAIQNIIKGKKKYVSSHQFIIDIEEGISPIEVDQARFELIMGNLLDNAVKYSTTGTEVTVIVKRRSEDILIGVRNIGRGISLENQTKLFKPFERLEETSTTKPGLGLGLLVCRRLVEVHGGDIWVESEPEKSSTFWFTLPHSQES